MATTTTNYQPPPTWTNPILETVDPATGKTVGTFSPVWLKWFLDLAQVLANSGGASSNSGGGPGQVGNVVGPQTATQAGEIAYFVDTGGKLITGAAVFKWDLATATITFGIQNDIAYLSGANATGTNASGCSTFVTGGTGNGTGDGGSVDLVAGAAGANGNGGSIELDGGAAGSAAGLGGAVTLVGGTGGVSDGGAVNLMGGVSGSAGNGGDVDITGGHCVTGFLPGGTVQIKGGPSDNGVGGDITLRGGIGDTADGLIYLHNLPTTDPGPGKSGAIWRDPLNNNVLKSSA